MSLALVNIAGLCCSLAYEGNVGFNLLDARNLDAKINTIPPVSRPGHQR